MSPIKNIFQVHKGHWSYNTSEIYCYIMYAIPSIDQKDWETNSIIQDFEGITIRSGCDNCIGNLDSTDHILHDLQPSPCVPEFQISLLLNPQLFCLLVLEACFPLFPSASFHLSRSPSHHYSLNASHKCLCHYALLIHIYLIYIHILQLPTSGFPRLLPFYLYLYSVLSFDMFLLLFSPVNK